MSDPAKRAAERIADDISEDNEREAWIAEAADIIRAEHSELMPCGHPRACRVDNPDPLGHLDRIYREQIAKGMLNAEQVDSLKISYFCTACEREASLRKELAVAQALCLKLGAQNCERERKLIEAGL